MLKGALRRGLRCVAGDGLIKIKGAKKKLKADGDCDRDFRSARRRS